METNSSIFNEDKTVFKRVGYLDLLKCLGMFIVVSGHIHTNYGWFSLPIHSYVIPLFFCFRVSHLKEISSRRFPVS